MRKSVTISAGLLTISALVGGCKQSQPGQPISPLEPQKIQQPTTSEQPVTTQTAPITPPTSQATAPQRHPEPAPEPTVIPPATTRQNQDGPVPTPVSPAPPPANALINPTGPAPANAQAELPDNATVDQILDALDNRGKNLREFTAKASLTSGDPLAGDVSTRVGKIMLQKKGQDDARLHVVFDQRVEGKTTRNEKSEYLLDNGWLTERDYRKKTETKREVLKPGDKMNLLSLGEGPFPLPLGQKKEDVHKMFEVTRVPLEPDETTDKQLAHTVHLTLVPKPGTRFVRRFGAIDVWVNRKSHFPVQIHTQAPDESDPHVTRLEDVIVNPPGGLKDSDFDLSTIDEQDWSLHSEPYRE